MSFLYHAATRRMSTLFAGKPSSSAVSVISVLALRLILSGKRDASPTDWKFPVVESFFRPRLQCGKNFFGSFCKLSHLKGWEGSVMFIIVTLPPIETECTKIIQEIENKHRRTWEQWVNSPDLHKGTGPWSEESRNNSNKGCDQEHTLWGHKLGSHSSQFSCLSQHMSRPV